MSKSIPFTKMHGLGNDFVVINALTQPFAANEIDVIALANRRTGIGFDQLLIIESDKIADFFCRIVNSDGSEASQCGNGLRCIARYVHENKMIDKSDFNIATKSGVYPISIKDYDHITVTFNTPIVEDLAFPLTHHQSISLINVGNPHAIIQVDDLQSNNIPLILDAILTHPHFKSGINIGFMQIINDHHARLRTIERGAGETLACGSNAAAAAYAALQNKWLSHLPVEISYLLGTLTVNINQDGLLLTGSAKNSFQGTFHT